MRLPHLINRCPHATIRGIYGDEINATGGRRLACSDCGRLLDGPVSLATWSVPETMRDQLQDQTYSCGCVVDGPAACPDATGILPERGTVTIHGTPRPKVITPPAGDVSAADYFGDFSD